MCLSPAEGSTFRKSVDMKRKSFALAFKRSIPIMIGFFPVGIAYGRLMANAGFSYLWSAFAGVTVFAGSLQMIIIPFLAGGAPIATVIVTALLLNSRHIFYGISFVDKFKEYGGWKYFLIYSLTDENYSLLCSYKPTDGVSEKWVHIFSSGLTWLYWIAFSVMGGLVGQLITFNTEGIDFALTALFIVILVEKLKSSESRLPALLAGVISVVGIAVLGADDFLLPSLCVTVASLLLLRPVIERKERRT